MTRKDVKDLSEILLIASELGLDDESIRRQFFSLDSVHRATVEGMLNGAIMAMFSQQMKARGTFEM